MARRRRQCDVCRLRCRSTLLTAGLDGHHGAPRHAAALPQRNCSDGRRRALPPDILAKPITLTTPRHKELMARAQRLWVDAVVHSDPSAKDLARVLRLPDTLNHKYSPPRVVEVIDGDPVRRWHDAERIAEILRPAVRQDEERQAAAAEAAKDAAKSAPPSWRKFLEWALDRIVARAPAQGSVAAGRQTQGRAHRKA